MRLYQESGGSIATTLFQYDGQAMIGEYDSSGTLQKRYVHGPSTDEPLVEYDRSGSSFVRAWIHADERGSVIAQSSDSGASTSTNTYDEYGVPGSGNVGRFGYTGQAWLPSLGLWYYKARMYSSRLGRFMQTDPIGYSVGMNWYRYVNGDPINLNDPTGLCAAGEVFVVPQHENHNSVDVGDGNFTVTAPPHYCIRIVAPTQSGVGQDRGNSSDGGDTPQSNLQGLARGACEALVDSGGDPTTAITDGAARAGQAIGAGVGAGVGGAAGKAVETIASKIAGRIGWEIGSASNILGAAAEGAKTGEKVAGRLGLVGAVAGAAAGAYFAPEIEKFKNDLKKRLCGG